MINLEKDVERLDYACRGDEVRNSLVEMFEHIQKLLKDKDNMVTLDEAAKWASSGVFNKKPMYLDHVDPDSYAAVQSGALYNRTGSTIKIIMAHGDEWERNYWILNQMPGYPAVDPPTPSDIYNPITIEVRGKEIEFEPGWFAKGYGNIIYPYNAEYITLDPHPASNELEIFYDVPIMQYPYLLQRPIVIVLNVSGKFEFRVVFIDENGDEVLPNDDDRCLLSTNNSMNDYEFIEDLRPVIDKYDTSWKLRLKFMGRAKVDSNPFSRRFFIERVRIIPYEVYKNG